MPATDSPAIVVARYLKANNYIESYDAFITEAGLPFDAGTVGKGDLTLETLLEEKKAFDLSVKFEKLGVDGPGGWTRPAPSAPHIVTTLPSSSNILSTAIETTLDPESSILLVTTADRRLHVLDVATHTLRTSLSGLHDSPILSCAVLQQRHLLTSSMSGQLLVSDLDGSTTERRRDHNKYVVKIAIHHDAANPLVATAGWDMKINIYAPSVSAEGAFSLGEPKATITLPTKPESLVFLTHPDNGKPILVVSRTDASHLFYYTTTDPSPRLLGKQNLAPHSNAWVAFTPSALALCPTDSTLLAVGTSSVPHMKLLLVRLLIPPYDASPQEDAAATQALQARTALALAERESAAIQIHCTTMAPQTPYSTPAVAWRPDGSGVWVNGDDGAVRGVEAGTGKVVATLRGHEAGSKVRCLWAGDVGEGGGDEVLVSGGFDQKLIVWKSGEEVGA